jgi:hypothetical protein
VSYTLLLALVEFKTLVMREQLEAAWALLPSIPQVRPRGEPTDRRRESGAERG